MKAIIVGTPCRGKTALADMIASDYPNTNVVSLGEMRSALGLHTPHKGYETEVNDKDEGILWEIIELLIEHHSNIILEGYGLTPQKAESLSGKYDIPYVLLYHANTDAEEDLRLARKYDAEYKWTRHREDDYLLNLFRFYKTVEDKWITQSPSEKIFATDKDFYVSLQKAYDYLATCNVK